MRALGAISCVGLAACANSAAEASREGFDPAYRGVETALLGEDLINVIVSIDDDRSREEASAYARCAAAQYTVFRGYGFLRHIRTTMDTEGGALKADAIYSVSPALPDGSKTIDAEVTVADCVASGIPTV